MSDYGQHSREGLCRRKTGSVHPSYNGGAVSAPGQAAQEDEVPDLEVFRELCLSTDSALWYTNVNAQAMGCSMESLVFVIHHLWLTLMEMKESEKMPLLDSRQSPRSLW